MIDYEEQENKKKMQNVREEIRKQVGQKYLDKKLCEYYGAKAEIVKKICERIGEMIKSGKNILFIGQRRTGKTLAARHIFEAAVLLGKDVIYRTAQDIMFDIMDFGREYIEKLKRSSLLIIDEVGKTVGSEKSNFELSRMLNILENRDRHQKSTILITNLEYNDLDAYIGLDMIERMKDKEFWSILKYEVENGK